MYNKVSSKLYPNVYKGFTLAEILITLVVIGVVATLTIPALLPKTNDAELRTAAKKAYSDLSQAVTKMAQDKGTLEDYVPDGMSFKPDFKPYLSVMKDCGWFTCIPRTLTSDIYKTYSGDNASTYFFDDGQFILGNGMTVMIENPNNSTHGIMISMDVNGYQKPPNIWGKDVFTFQIINDQLKPVGVPDSIGTQNYTDYSTYCSKTSSSNNNGISCGVFVLADKDY